MKGTTAFAAYVMRTIQPVKPTTELWLIIVLAVLLALVGRMIHC